METEFVLCEVGNEVLYVIRTLNIPTELFWLSFLGAFASSFVMSISLSVHTEQLSSHWTDIL
jgi:hypothetical protein